MGMKKTQMLQLEHAKPRCGGYQAASSEEK